MRIIRTAKTGIIFTACLLLVLLSSGCANRVAELNNWNPEDYTVQSGDTLFSIAWRYEIDYRELARWNNIGESYAIFPGQRLHTRVPKNFVEQHRPDGNTRKKSVQQTRVTVARGDTLYSLSRKTGHSVEQLARWNALTKPYTLLPGQHLYLEPVAHTSRKPGPGKKVTTSTRIEKWLWPVKGKLLSGYGSRSSSGKTGGIDIAGKTGDTVVASAQGRVVYSGNGLISYGNLLIIKHNNTYLSAYAHNSKLLVKEGSRVSAGQTIAKLGDTGSTVPKLHFEIRKNGKPVNPLDYLPIQ